MAGLGAWALWTLALLGLGTVPWFDHLLRQADRPELTQLDASTIPYLLAIVVAATVGAVLAGRLPRHPVGWLLLALGLAVAASGVADGYARYGLVARPGALPAANWVAVYSPATTVVGLALVGFVLLLTPTGSPPSPGWRWWARVAAAGPVLFVAALTAGPGLVIPPYESALAPVTIPALAGAVLVAIVAGFLLTVAGLMVGAGSLMARFRRARGVERQQLRWLALAAALTGVAAAVVGAGTAMDATAVPLFAAGVYLALLPLATGAAILRYRLYDLDRIVSRTVAYGLPTVLLGGGYAVVVLGLGELLGRDSGLVVAGGDPGRGGGLPAARRRVQAAVDRRFNRRRYDAAQTIATFGDRLRQQVDLDSLTGELLAVVGRTMQPTSVSLWLRDPVGHSPSAPSPAPPGRLGSSRLPCPPAGLACLRRGCLTARRNHMDRVTSRDGTPIAYERQGAGPAVILVGGAFVDRSEDAPLAAELAGRFSTYNYDRRGRGDSGDTPPHAVEREIDDIQTLIAEAGGSAHLYGISSGGALVLEAAAAGVAVDRLAVYEVPYDLAEDGPRRHREYVARLEGFLAEGRRGDAAELFMRMAGASDEMVAGARSSPMWPGLEAIAHTLPYDAACVGGDNRPPTDRLAGITRPTLVAVGGSSPDSFVAGGGDFFARAADAIAAGIPRARRLTVEGQTHMVDPEVLARVLERFFTGPA